MSSKIDSVHGSITKDISSEPEYITAECVRQKKMANAASMAAQQNNNFNHNNGKRFLKCPYLPIFLVGFNN